MAKRIRPTSYLFPIGFIISVDNETFNPNKFYSNGKWERIKGRMIVGVDEADSDFSMAGKIGGSKFLQNHNHLLNIGANSAGGPLERGYGVVYTATNRYLIPADNPDTGEFSGFGTGTTGAGDSGNMSPYYTAYIWKLVSYL